MVCLDSDFLIDLLRKNDAAITKLRYLTATNQKLCTTVVTVAELYKGAHKFKNSDKISKIKLILDEIQILPFTTESAEKFGELFYHDEIKSNRPGDMDLLIASITLTSNETFLTRNMRHFSVIPNLKTESW
ncbi:MAG: type II toxin-antitoxin system VapC family toxin [Nitrosarchaeum sp.]|nr:type II toxin-antitoxin system VapC family toxin [Nitrosarchaeum sp.]